MLRTGGSDTGQLFSLLDLETGKVVGFDAGLSQMLAQYILGETEHRVDRDDRRHPRDADPERFGGRRFRDLLDHPGAGREDRVRRPVL